MFLSAAFLTLCAAVAVTALPLVDPFAYAVKERHALPAGWTKIGSASKSETIHLQIGVKQRNEGAVEAHLLEISDPTHARYGKYLTASEIHDIVSPSDESVERIHSWLLEHEITNMMYSPAKDWVSVLIPLEKAEQLLQTSYSTFQHLDGSTMSRALEWSLPEHLHEHIDVVQPTTSFFRPLPNARPLLDEKSYSMDWWEKVGQGLYGGDLSDDSDSASVSQVCNASFVTLRCLRTYYGTLGYKPQAPDQNRIGINDYLNQTNKRSDIKKFLHTFRPAAVAAAEEFEIVIIANASNDQGPYTKAQIKAQANVEGNLDAELVLGITWPTPMTAFATGGSPPFHPDLATETDTNEPYLTYLNYVLAQSDLPQVISSSYGDDEQSVPESYAKRVCAGFAQLGARGISCLVSSGDFGVGEGGKCRSNTVPGERTFLPVFPATCPWVTSVGATKDFNPEKAVTRFGSGGGFSNYFPAPSYQKSVVEAYIQGLNGLYNGLYNTTGRGFPDVAAQGNQDVIVWAGNVTRVGGTSCASPTFASVISLVNDALLAKGKPVLGFLNPWLYAGAYKALNDITIGSSLGCAVKGFPAEVGWDAVTGWGTPNFPKLVEAAMWK